MSTIETKGGRIYVHRRDSVYMLQRFWKAEVRGRTVVSTTDGHFWQSETTKKSYPSEAAADRAARADYAKKLLVGFVPIPEIELIPLMRLVFRVGVRGEGDKGYPKKLGEPSRNVVYACRVQRYWRGEVRAADEKFVTSHGDIGGAIVTRTFPLSQKGHSAMYRDEHAHVHIGDGWYQSSRKELAPIERHIKAMNKRLAQRPPAPVDLPPRDALVPTIVPRKVTRARTSRS